MELVESSRRMRGLRRVQRARPPARASTETRRRGDDEPAGRHRRPLEVGGSRRIAGSARRFRGSRRSCWPRAPPSGPAASPPAGGAGRVRRAYFAGGAFRGWSGRARSSAAAAAAASSSLSLGAVGGARRRRPRLAAACADARTTKNAR